MEFHPASEIVRKMQDDEFQALAEDIRANGLLVPVELLDGQIIDGRHRWRACTEVLGWPEDDVETIDVDLGDMSPEAYVISTNVKRRHLTTSERAMLAARGIEYYEKQAKQRQADAASKAGKASGASRRGERTSSPHGDNVHRSSDDAASRAGVGARSVQRAKAVLTGGHQELVDAVDNRTLTVTEAEPIARLPKEDQPDAIKEATKPKTNGKPPKEPKKFEDKNFPGARGAGIRIGNEAIDVLKRIEPDDPLRKDGLEMVALWIRRNK